MQRCPNSKMKFSKASSELQQRAPCFRLVRYLHNPLSGELRINVHGLCVETHMLLLGCCCLFSWSKPGLAQTPRSPSKNLHIGKRIRTWKPDRHSNMRERAERRKEHLDPSLNKLQGSKVDACGFVFGLCSALCLK